MLPSPTSGGHFSAVPSINAPRSKFRRDRRIKTTINVGGIYPIFTDEVLPGDTKGVQMTIFARLATPIYPIMDDMTGDMHFFFIPNRILWDNWERLNGAQDNPDDPWSTDYLCPEVIAPGGGFPEGSLEDYMGIPTKVAGLHVTCFHQRAYNRCINDWYRRTDLMDSLPVHTDDGPDPSTDYAVAVRTKMPDYLVSCLPYPQRGPDVQLPLGATAPVVFPNGVIYGTNLYATGSGGTLQGNLQVQDAGTGFLDVRGSNIGSAPVVWADSFVQSALPTDAYANLSAAVAATVNDQRLAFQLQKLLERDARGGTRYPEILLAHWGVVSPDFRLQRPEYLGGASSKVMIHPVAQTSESGTTPQGNLAAFGTITITGGFRQSFVEHGVILGLLSIRPNQTYQQGLHRMWSRRTRYDFWTPEFSGLGEQAVLNKEIFAQANSDDNLPFGYIERGGEYRYAQSLVTGLMRSNATLSLDSWHLAQEFASLPALGPDFIKVDDTPVKRAIKTPSQPQFIVDSYFQQVEAREMPMYGVPGLIDHF